MHIYLHIVIEPAVGVLLYADHLKRTSMWTWIEQNCAQNVGAKSMWQLNSQHMCVILLSVCDLL